MPRISVYNVYALAMLMAIGAAVLSGVVLGQAFDAQQTEREKSQAATGIGQAQAIQSLILAQLNRMQTDSDGNTNQFGLQTLNLPDDTFNASTVIANLNGTIFGDWVPEVRAVHQLNGFGVSMFYPPDNVTFDRSFQIYADVLLDGTRQYMYAYFFSV